jgi:hypothetical protein|tara:strand:- start:79 stop:258 length:180 start_codon:yes stop_codon:yes gene_type:complete
MINALSQDRAFVVLYRFNLLYKFDFITHNRNGYSQSLGSKNSLNLVYFDVFDVIFRRLE